MESAIDTEVQQQPITTQSEIKRVVVYGANRAQVFRRCELTVPPGQHTVHVEGLWACADRDSLQVALAKGGAQTVLRAVQFTSVTTVQDVRPQVAEVEQQIAVQEREKKRVEEEIALVVRAEDAYAQVRAKLTKPTVTCEEGKAVPTAYDPVKWAKVSAFIARGVTEQRQKRLKLNRELAKVDAELKRLKDQLAGFGPSHVRRTSKDVAELLFTVKAAEAAAAANPVQLVMELSYLVQGAGWTPLYDIRIDRKNRSMQLAYNANVHNSTGEEWRDVKLELSTANATSRGTIPPLRTWELQDASEVNQFGCYDADVQMERMVCKSAAPPMMQQMMVTNMMPMMAGAAAPAPPPPPRPRDFRAATSSSAAVAQQGGSSTFRVAATATIKSDRQPVKVAVAVLDLPVHFRYSAVPKLDPKVYLKVRAVNTSSFDILAGRANVFSDNQLVTHTTLDKVAPNEDFWTFLGTDEDITVKRSREPNKTVSTAGGFLSSKKKVRTFTFHYTVKNQKGTEEEVVIWDQYPIPDDKRIVVEGKMPPFESDRTPCELRPVGSGRQVAPVSSWLVHKTNEDRFIEWFVPAAPNTEVKFDFSFAVEHPLDISVDV
jgi:uncharacterized protein (TIGR02231 family)